MNNCPGFQWADIGAKDISEMASNTASDPHCQVKRQAVREGITETFVPRLFYKEHCQVMKGLRIQLLETIRTRRSIRKFKNQDVPDDLIRDRSQKAGGKRYSGIALVRA